MALVGYFVPKEPYEEMSSLPSTKPTNPLKDAIQRAYRRQREICCCCHRSIATGYYIEHVIDEIVVLKCETCKKRDEQRLGGVA